VEEAKAIRTLILDTNVLISSLVRSEGVTRIGLTILLHDGNYEVLAPAAVVEEVRAHAQEICRKANITQPLLDEAFDRVLENVKLVTVASYRGEFQDALQFISDESDAPFAALALARSPSTIITYNKRHFNCRGLLRRGVRVLTPAEALRELR
jgi:predicted nucleic acid-binding protein